MPEKDITQYYHFSICSRIRLRKPALASYVVGFYYHRHLGLERRARNQDSIATRYRAAAALVAGAVLIFVLVARLDSSVRDMPLALVSNSDSHRAG